MIRLFKFHLPVIAYAGAIFFVSSLPNLTSPQNLPLAFDKLAHLAEYAIFAWLVFRAFGDLLPRQSNWMVGLLGCFFLLGFAILDEMYQGTITGRHQDPMDILADLIGSVLVIALLVIRRNRLNPKS